MKTMSIRCPMCDMDLPLNNWTIQIVRRLGSGDPYLDVIESGDEEQRMQMDSPALVNHLRTWHSAGDPSRDEIRALNLPGSRR